VGGIALARVDELVEESFEAAAAAELMTGVVRTFVCC